MFLDGPYSEMYDDEMRRLARRINKIRNATVAHHETCPICGAKLVNLYRRENDWRCRMCWEKYDADPNHAVKLGPWFLYKIEEDGTRTIIGLVHKED